VITSRKAESGVDKNMEKFIFPERELITVFGDIHGNLPALQAFFSEIELKDYSNLFCLGDLVGYGTSPNQVVEAIRERNIPTIMGNYDLGVGSNSDDCGCDYKTPEARALGERSIAWTNQHTTEDNKAYLRGLVESIPIQLGDMNILLVHGSPRKINEYLYEDRPDKSLERIMDGIDAEVMVCGHTHIPYRRILPSGRQVINAGSIGKPKDNDPRACYITLKVEGGRLDVDFHRVEYDVEAAAAAIEAETMPDEFAHMLRMGQG
jgi:predicted phosphodiesterase